MTQDTGASRVNIFLRLMGALFFVLGAVMTYLTYSEAAQGNLVPQITPVFYLISGLLLLSGFTAAVVKYK